MLVKITWLRSKANLGLDTWVFELKLGDGSTLELTKNIPRNEGERLLTLFRGPYVSIQDIP